MKEIAVIVAPDGTPARAVIEHVCPTCGQGPEQRRPSGGFGVPWTVCTCGQEWKDVVWRG